ncbi:uncharacterized protein TNCV_970551 [Trichonephila clavipes]|nr:uncharacterized protein TNCV_970551 [Trichonephila clavipes]
MHLQFYECIMRSFLIDECRISEFLSYVCTYPNATFGAQWIGCGGPVTWPPRSPDLSSLDYFLWGHLKNLIYATPLDSDEDLVARISKATARECKILGIFECVRQLLHRRCQACIATGGRNFEQLL